MPDGRKASPRAGRARRPKAAQPALDAGTEVMQGSGRAEGGVAQGVVIHATDTTIRVHAKSLGTTKRDAKLANSASARILADASHDLRQPLQALALLQGLLAARTEGAASERLVAKLAKTIATMSSIVDRLQRRIDENCGHLGQPATPVELARLSPNLLPPSKRPAIDAALDLVPALMITGSSDVRKVGRAMKAGSIEKPIAADLLASIDDAFGRAQDASRQTAWRISAAEHLAGLTPRQLQILDLVLEGHPSKNIAADLGISQRTVENHRASIMRRTGTRSLPALARLVLAVSTAVAGTPSTADARTRAGMAVGAAKQ